MCLVKRIDGFDWTGKKVREKSDFFVVVVAAAGIMVEFPFDERKNQIERILNYYSNSSIIIH